MLRMKAGVLALALVIIGGALFSACNPAPTYQMKLVSVPGSSYLGQLYKDGRYVGGFLAQPGDTVHVTSVDDDTSSVPDVCGEQPDPTTEITDVRFCVEPASTWEDTGNAATVNWLTMNNWVRIKNGLPDLDSFSRAVGKLLGEAVPTDNDDPAVTQEYAAQDTVMSNVVSSTHDQFVNASATTSGIVEDSSGGATITLPGTASIAAVRPMAVVNGQDLSLAKGVCQTTSWQHGGKAQSCAILWNLIHETDANNSWVFVEQRTDAYSGDCFPSGPLGSPTCQYTRRLGIMQDVNENGSRIWQYAPDSYIGVGSCHNVGYSFSGSVSAAAGGASGSFSETWPSCPEKYGPYHRPIGIGETDTLGVEWLGGHRNGWVSQDSTIFYSRRVGTTANWRMQTSLTIQCHDFWSSGKSFYYTCRTPRFP